MDRYDSGDTHLVFEGISAGIENKFGLEAIFYSMGYLAFIIVALLFVDLFFTSLTSPIFYSNFAPMRRSLDGFPSIEQAISEVERLVAQFENSPPTWS